MLNVVEFSCHDKLVLNLLDILFKPERINHIHFFEIINFRLLTAILLKKNVGLLQLMQSSYQEGLQNICLRFNQSSAIEEQRKIEYLRNYLCILPYFEFQHGTIIQLPWFDDVQKLWLLKNYQINKIRLNQQYFWMNQADLCYAYGLIEIDGPQRLLIISGTSYPCGEGFWPHVVNDISIGVDVGYFLYRDGREAMFAFIGDGRHCEVLGTSLGGAMALQLGLDCPNLKLVYALNPPGRITQMSKDAQTAPTMVVIQAKDFVSQFGFWHPNWSIVHYAFKTGANRPPQFFDHFSNYALLADVTRENLDPTQLNQNRFWLTAIIFFGLRALCTVVMVWPIRYLIIPILKLLYAAISPVFDCFANKEGAAIPAALLSV